MPRAKSTTRQRPPDIGLTYARTENAHVALSGLQHGGDVFCLTHGQFSLIDALYALLQITGPAESVTVSTWTAGNADLTTAAALMEKCSIGQIRWLVDRSFLTRQPAYCAKMRELFGDDCIRTMPCHAKFMTIRAGEWRVAVRTSMNMNRNARLEYIEVSDSEPLVKFFESIVDEAFAEQPDGLFANCKLPAPKLSPIKMGKASV